MSNASSPSASSILLPRWLTSYGPGYTGSLRQPWPLPLQQRKSVSSDVMSVYELLTHHPEAIIPRSGSLSQPDVPLRGAEINVKAFPLVRASPGEIVRGIDEKFVRLPQQKEVLVVRFVHPEHAPSDYAQITMLGWDGDGGAVLLFYDTDAVRFSGTPEYGPIVDELCAEAIARMPRSIPAEGKRNSMVRAINLQIDDLLDALSDCLTAASQCLDPLGGKPVLRYQTNDSRLQRLITKMAETEKTFFPLFS